MLSRFDDILKIEGEDAAIRYFREHPEIVFETPFDKDPEVACHMGYVQDAAIVCMNHGAVRTLRYVYEHCDPDRLFNREIHLHYASVRVNKEVRESLVREVLNSGEDPNGLDGWGMTAIEWSCIDGDVSYVSFLISRGATLYSEQIRRIVDELGSSADLKAAPLYVMRERINVFWLFWFRLPPGSIRTLLKHFFKQ